jgi:signal transduction histidine kinase
LSVILGFAQSLLQRLSPADPLQLPIRSIAREGIRCTALLQDLLLLSDRSVPLVESIELNVLVEEALESLGLKGALPPSVEIRREFAEDLKPVSGENFEIHQALTHLIRNAIEAMPGGGVLRIATRAFTRKGRLWAAVDVIDNGGGMPKEVQARLFEPFFTWERPSGTGLGLCYVSSIVKRHHGEVEFESVAARGTRFTISFPQGRRPPA